MSKTYLLLIIYTLASVLYGQDSVKLTFAGDLMAHDINFKTKPLTDIYKGVNDILLSDDLSFINLEFPIDEERIQSSYPSFNVHPDYLEAAITSGFDVFSLANNHTNDFGLGSVIKTINNMNLLKERFSIIYSGVYGDGESRFSVETIQVREMTLGYIAITQFNNNYWNKEGAARIYTVDYKNSEESEKFLEFIKEISGNYDCLILSYHGGREYLYNTEPDRAEFFDKTIEAGVDIVWAHHPHVLQPWKHFSTDRGDKLILYSMGNFISGQLAIVDPNEHNENFAATGFSSLFTTELKKIDGRLVIENSTPNMIANIRNENNYFVAVEKDDALKSPMSDEWKKFYEKMFPIAENRIRKN